MENRPPDDANDAAFSASSQFPRGRFTCPGITILLSFTTAIASILASTMMYFLSCKLLHLLLLLVAAPVTLAVAVSCCWLRLRQGRPLALGPKSGLAVVQRRCAPSFIRSDAGTADSCQKTGFGGQNSWRF